MLTVWSIRLMNKNMISIVRWKLTSQVGHYFFSNRFAKRNETKIHGGKICKNVIGYDANALYIWCLGNKMPCGRLTTIDVYDDIIDDINDGKTFGFLQCDTERPEHLNDYFSDRTAIFKNIEIDPTDEIIGRHMFGYNQTRDKGKAKKSRKLIGSFWY
ncbi:unnamed protein product [Phytophthora fragariaefolia]|uniref:Unnamed protein product n=1 Tax=Phytophthora fragariaefolia TaxID=1490495 RepID=A0A9W6U2W1_9STRA|nr:unnamed protein product [Phytophthora fragariaefolia]